MATLYQIANTSPPPPRELNADIPEWLDATIMALLNKDRERRPTAAEAKQAFDSTVRPTVAPGDSQQTTSHTDQQPAENRPASTAPPAFGTAHDTAADRSRRPKRLVSLTFGVLAIILIGLAARQWMRPPRVVVTTGAELKAAIESYDGRIHVAVRTNETLTVDPIVIAGLRRHVILTGAKGFHPVLVAADTTQPLLTAHGNRLELDAIELRSEADDVPLLYLENVQFSARQSRLAAHSTGGCIATVGDSVVELRDCELHGGSGHVFHLGEGLRPEVTLTNCIQSGTYAFTLEPNSSPTLTWERSTVFASHLFHVPVVRSTTAATNAETRRPTPSGDNTPADQVVIKSERSIVHADQSIMSGHWERAFRWKIYSQESRYVGPFAHEESDLASDLENSIRNERGSHLFAQPPQHIAVRIQTPHQLRHQDFQLRSDQLRQGKLRSMGVDFGNLRHLAAGEVRRLAK